MNTHEQIDLVLTIQSHLRTGTVDDLLQSLQDAQPALLQLLNHCPPELLKPSTQSALKAWCTDGLPNNERLRARAILLRDGGHLVEAERLWVKTMSPGATARNWCDLGALQAGLQRWQVALESHTRALNLDPSDPLVAFEVGIFMAGLGQSVQAEGVLRHACSLAPNNPQAWLELGNVYKEQSRWSDALGCYQKAHALDRSRPEPLNNLGTALKQMGRLTDALAAWANACALDPQHLYARLNRGALLSDMGHHDQALREFQQAVAVSPADFHAHYGVAEALHRLGRHEDALAALITPELLGPTSPQPHLTRGNCLTALGEFEAAILAYQRCLQVAPHFAEAYINWGSALQELNRHDEACDVFERALAQRPDYAGARWNRANSKLIQALTPAAWDDYECRHQIGMAARLPKACPPLLKGPIKSGQRVLMVWDQRYGDIIHALRYLPAVAERCPDALWQIAPAMQALFAASFPTARMVGVDTWPNEAVVALPITSLPYRMGAFTSATHSASDLGSLGGYLKAPASRMTHWATALDGLAPKVGLAWRGQPVPLGRSISLEELQPVLDVSSVQFHALQLDLRAEETRLLERRRISDLGSCIQDFADTASIISQLDLVITVDTAVAHLAGALGKSVWVLLKHGGDWRWVTTPGTANQAQWYSSARVYQQRFVRSWHDPVQAMKAALNALQVT
jgi:tetratricopeptide (TPR) repeat protein